MSELKLETLNVLIYLLKWFMGIVAACVPMIIIFFVRINKGVNDIKAEQRLQSLAHDHLAEKVEKSEGHISELQKLAFKAN